MGMYTEIILGCGLKVNTPEVTINALKWLCGVIEKPDELPDHEYFLDNTHNMSVLKCGSYYFGVCDPHSKIWHDDISNNWRISARGNIKNYGDDIESFLDWLKPFIEQGSGDREFYAIVCYEEQEIPTIYYLEDKDDD